MINRFMSIGVNDVLSLLDRGFAVLPCVPGDKRPALKTGINDATKSHRLVEKWFQINSRYNWGVATGASGLLVIDVDQHGTDGNASLQQAQKELGDLPETLMCSTPSGGYHLYFKAPADVSKIKAKTGFYPGVDIRCNNTYVLAPPSVIGNGRYQYNLSTDVIADLPERWTMRLVEASDKTSGFNFRKQLAQVIRNMPDNHKIINRCRSYVSKMPIAIAGQGGSVATLAVANVIFWGFGLSYEDGFPILENYNAFCKPCWSREELEHKVQTALAGLDSKPKGYLLGDMADQKEPQIITESTGSFTATDRPNIINTKRRDKISCKSFGCEGTTKPYKLVFGEGNFGTINTMDLLTKNLQTAEFIIKPWLRKGDTALIYGPAGTFKTWLLYYLSVAIASGTGTIRNDTGYDWTAPQIRRVMYLDGEMRPQTVQSRLKAIQERCVQLNTPFNASNIEYFNAILQDIDLDLAKSSDQKNVLDYATNNNIDVLVVDNLSCLYKCDDANKRESWEPLNELIKESRRRNLTLLIADHVGKTSNTARGSSAKLDMPEIGIQLSRVGKRTDGKIKIEFAKGRELSGDELRPIVTRFDNTEFVVDTLATRATLPETENERKRREVETALKKGLTVREIVEKGLAGKNFVYRVRAYLFNSLG